VKHIIWFHPHKTHFTSLFFNYLSHHKNDRKRNFIPLRVAYILVYDPWFYLDGCMYAHAPCGINDY
jgi:hypothetical protein